MTTPRPEATRRNGRADGLANGTDPATVSYTVSEQQVAERNVEAIFSRGEHVTRLLTEHRDALGRLAAALLERGTLDEQEILEVTGLPPAPALESARVAEAESESRRAASRSDAPAQAGSV